jgi:outer membrane receptor for ferrienterochelin and colicins
MPIGFSARIEQHPVHGLLVMPQLGGRTEIAKWNLGASVGRGLRTVNLATEDHAFLSGTRQVVVPAGLPPERAWSGGLGVGRLWLLGKSNRATFQFDADLFGTRFQTRIAADLGEIGVVNYVNAPGAYAYGTTVAMGLTFSNGVEIQGNVTVQRSQFGENDASGKLVYQNEFYLPRAMGTATVELPGRLFAKSSRFAQALRFNLNARATGQQRMPAQPFDATLSRPRPEYSPSYVEMDALATFVTKTYIKLSLGVRNLLNYRQVTPIVGGSDPFGPGFDPNYVYGPLVGRRVVVGVQVPIGKSK